ncbi:hypothetical protein BDB00DRAFT_795149 [Zychaea mexicana]|uniref:uncharacterized protein n=1 Tax=Zychaea mexicana TaxID=64656 RepID=UPI0022FE9538|nr:uncharacterized protein BDB00DRAFT_795149 [Zychaea mexicana]KAI9499691.1 hypothetical protein BDB00DRAFT_795149 [Zychaea mexicana]
MSFRFTTHEHYNDGTTSLTQSTVIVRELDDNESAQPDLLKAPPPTYEIESGVSSEEEDEYSMLTPQDDRNEEDRDEDEDQEILHDHWFPSLLHRSIIEFLDDDDGDDDIYMMDHPFDMLTSNESAVIVEQGDQDDEDEDDDRQDKNKAYYRHVHLEGDGDDDMEQEEEPISDKKRSSPPRRRRHKKRSKHVAGDKENEEVPIEVVHILL